MKAPDTLSANPSQRDKIEAELRGAVNTLARATETEHIMQFFEYAHLPPHLQAVSKPFCDLAISIVHGEVFSERAPLPRNPERTVALRKLLEAKDAAVRALVAK